MYLGSSRDVPAWRSLGAACKVVKDVIEVEVNRHIDVYAKELKVHTRVGDMSGWYRHLKGGWGLSGPHIESE